MSVDDVQTPDAMRVAQEKYEQQKREFFNSCTAERNRFIASKTEEAKSYDKSILTFAAGAIGISLTFVEKIAPAPVAPFVLYVSWSFFALAILSVIISFVVSQAAMDAEIAWIDEAWAGVNAGKAELPAQRANRYTKLTRAVNWTSGLLFVAGVATLVIFGAVNWPPAPIHDTLSPKPLRIEIVGNAMTNTSTPVTTTAPATSTRGNAPAPALVQPAPQPPSNPAPTSTPSPAPTTSKP